MVKGLEYMPYGKRLKEPALLSLDKRQLLLGGTYWQLAIAYMEIIKYCSRRTGGRR